MNSIDDFFGFTSSMPSKSSSDNASLNPILFCDESPCVNAIVAEYLSNKKLEYLKALFHKLGASVNIVYVFSTIDASKHRAASTMAKFFTENVIPDLNDYLIPNIPVVAVGRAIYATTYDSDIQVMGFYDSVFNKTYFYSPFMNNRVYPIDAMIKFCGFGQFNKDTGMIKDWIDCWELHFAQEQIKRAITAGDCRLLRKRQIKILEVENPNEWLNEKIENITENEMWVAIDTETDGVDNKLSCHIGDLTISFDGYTAYHLCWSKVNPRIFTKFCSNHKCIFANGKFDILFFMYHGCDLITPAWDTMIAGHLLNEMRSNSLKTHAFCYTNYGGYDLDLEKFKWKYSGLKNYLQIPDAVRIPYACMDAAVTYQVWQAEKRDMQKETELWDYYHNYCLPMLRVFIKAEFRGFCVDWNKVRSVGETIQKNIKEALSNVRKAFKNPTLDPNKKQELGKFIQSLGWTCINKTKAGGYKVSKKEFAEWEKMGHTEVKTLNEYSKWMIIWNTFIGEDAVDKDDTASTDTQCELDDNFFNTSDTSTSINTHDATGLWQYKTIDNRVHTTYHAFMTNSHRHRSSSPNLQNIPHHNKEVSSIVRQCYVPPDIVLCTPNEAQQVWVFDRINGVSICSMQDTVEIGMKRRVKVKVCELHNYDFNEYGFKAQWHKFTEEYCKKEEADFVEIQDDKLGMLRLPCKELVRVKQDDGTVTSKPASEIVETDTILLGGS